MTYDQNFERLKQLVELAEELGVDQDDWFFRTIHRLGASWNEQLYQKTLDMLMKRDIRPILDDTFSIPMGAEDLKAVSGPYRIALRRAM